MLKRDLVFVTLLATATALFVVGDALADPGLGTGGVAPEGFVSSCDAASRAAPGLRGMPAPGASCADRSGRDAGRAA